MNKKPKFTIITSTFNAENCFETLAKSIIAQKYKNIEWIVIDGGSKDKTRDLIKRHKEHIAYWVSEPDFGIYDAWNKGLKEVSGDWVIFLGSDDYFSSSQSLERVAKFTESQPLGVELIYGKVDQLAVEDCPTQTLGVEWSKAEINFKSIMTIPNPGVFYKASLFSKFGKFNPNFKIAGDYEFLLRVISNGVKPLFFDCLVTYMGGDGISAKPENGLRSLNEAAQARKLLGINPVHPFVWVVAFSKAAIKYGIRKIIGAKKTSQIVKIVRTLNHKKSK